MVSTFPLRTNIAFHKMRQLMSKIKILDNNQIRQTWNNIYANNCH